MEKRIKAYIQLTEEWLQTKEALSQQEREDFQREYLVHLSFYQHERMVHLLVTILFAILAFLSIGIAIVGEYPAMFLVTAYIRHYYFLENTVQKMYDLYDRI